MRAGPLVRSVSHAPLSPRATHSPECVPPVGASAQALHTPWSRVPLICATVLSDTSHIFGRGRTSLWLTTWLCRASPHTPRRGVGSTCGNVALTLIRMCPHV